MKLILAITQPSKLEAVKEALNKVEVFRLTIVDVQGFGRQKGRTEVYRDLIGKERVFQKADIVQRTELKTSLMPPGLVASLTDQELRDLLAFLRENTHAD